MAGRAATGLTAAAVGTAAAAIYWTTLLPGVSTWDTAEAQAALPLLGTMHPTGFPAYAILGWLASVVIQPIGEPAFRINLLSALLVAGAVGAMVPLLRRFDVPVPVAAAAAAGLALTPINWAIASAADAHALHLALVAMLTVTLVRWASLVDERRQRPGDDAAAARADRGLVLAAVVFGVSLANHGLTLLLVPAVGLYVLAVDPGVLRRPRLVISAAGACATVAAVLYLELPLRAGPFRAPLVYGHPDTWDGFWEIVLARQFQGDVGAALRDLPSMVANLAAFTTGQLGALAVLVVPAFIMTAARFPRYALLSGVATGVTCVFAASYLNADIGRYYLGPAWFAWTWLAIAAGMIVRVVLDRARSGTPDPTAAEEALERPPAPGHPAARTSVAFALSAVLLLPTGLGLAARWHAADRSGDTTAAVWLDDAMARMDPDAVVVSWWSYSTTLWYGTLVEGRRPDLLIVDDSNLVYDHLGSAEDVIDRYLGRRPVLVIRSSAPDIEALAVRYVLEPLVRPAGVYRVTGPRETAP